MSDTATETPTTDHRTDAEANIHIWALRKHWKPIAVAARDLGSGVVLDLGPVHIHLDDADALADLHQRIGRQLVELGRGEVRS